MDEDPDMQHEIEMGTEEFLGRPLSGPAAERLAALQGRVDYLIGEINKLVQQVRHGQLTEHDAADENRRLTEELAQARNLLADFQSQQSQGPN